MSVPDFNFHRYSSVTLPELLKQKQLPKTLKPDNYFLRIHPFFTRNYFVGIVKIKITCLEATKDIVLHSSNNLRVSYNDIKLTKLGDTVEENRNIEVPSVSKNARAQMLFITTEEELQVGAMYEVYLSFRGDFNSSKSDGLIKGKSRCYSTDTESWYACSKLFPIHARQVFPCFDEPSFKASFDIVIGHPKDMTALSVMPLDHTEEDPANEDWVLDYFTQTPPIAPFSVTMLISKFISSDVIQIFTPQGSFKLQFHAQEDLLESQKAEAVHVPFTLKFFGDYVGVGYPLPKLDISFIIGLSFAMQANAVGHLMIQEGIMRESYVEHIPVFVNLWLHHMVTPEWWTEFNLTTYLGSYLTRLSYITLTGREYWSTYGWGDRNCFYHSFGIRNPQEDFEFKLNGAYRGEWFFRMLSSALTEETFRAGLKKFFTDNLYGTFTENLFWTTLENQGKAVGNLPESVSLKEVAKSWLGGDSYNYPVLNVTRNYDQNSASLEQQMFLLQYDSVLTEEEEKLLWWLPVMYLTPEKLDSKSLHPVLWMGEKKSTITSLPDDHSFVIINPTDEGMFLVNYDQQNWNLIIKFLIKSPNLLHYTTRRKVLDDAFHLNTAGLLDYITTLNMTLFLLNEAHTTVWLSVCSWFNDLHNRCQWTVVEAKLNTYLRCLLSPRVNKNGDDHDSDTSQHEWSFDDSMFQSEVGGTLSKIISQQDIDSCYEILKTKMSTFTVYDEDTGFTLFFPEFMKNEPEDNPEHRKSLLLFAETMSQLPCFYIDKCPGYDVHIQSVLNDLLDENKVMSLESWYSLEKLLTSNLTVHNITLNFVMDHYQELKDRFYPFKDLWEPLFSAVTDKVKTQEGLEKLMQLYEEQKEDLGYSLKILENSIEKVKEEVKWVNRCVPDLEYWLDQSLPQLKKFQEDKTVQLRPVLRHK